MCVYNRLTQVYVVGVLGDMSGLAVRCWRISVCCGMQSRWRQGVFYTIPSGINTRNFRTTPYGWRDSLVVSRWHNQVYFGPQIAKMWLVLSIHPTGGHQAGLCHTRASFRYVVHWLTIVSSGFEFHWLQVVA